jgi:ATP-dependent Clp protease ATP-binding subunit ClpA
LLTARIQAQEQRIIYLDRQRAEAATRRSSAEQARDAIATQIQTFAGGDISKLNAEQRRDMEPMIAMLKKQVASQDSIVAQLQTEETDAANALAQEQGRWADLNQRLEDLERLLK